MNKALCLFSLSLSGDFSMSENIQNHFEGHLEIELEMLKLLSSVTLCAMVVLTDAVSLVMLYSCVSSETLCNSWNFTAKILISGTADPVS